MAVASLTEALRDELLPNIVRVMLAAFLEVQARRRPPGEGL